MPVYLTPPPQGPLARLLAAVIGAVLLAGAFMVGMVAFLVMLGVAAVAGAWLWFRTWKLRRTMRRRQPPGEDDPEPAEAGSAIEGEFTVVSREEDR